MTRFLAFWFFVFIVNIGQSQVEELLAEFTVRQLGNKVRVDCGIKGGASCQGIWLERSLEGGDFEVVDVISGVCGGSEFTEYYELEDLNPSDNQLNTYRLRLGASGLSQTISLLFVPITDGLIVFPSSVDGQIVIKWENTVYDGEVIIRDQSGKQMEVFLPINGNEVVLNVEGIQRGLHIITLVEGELIRANVKVYFD
ncbi:MAG: hypothetical protein RL226_1414 [Bacteroidota bacterium]|jgi:hypothetical protein